MLENEIDFDRPSPVFLFPTADFAFLRGDNGYYGAGNSPRLLKGGLVGARSLPCSGCHLLAWWSIALFRCMPMLLDFFRLLLVDMRKRSFRTSICPQKLIELCVNRLGVAVFGALDEKRHAPSRKRSEAVPIKRLRLQ